MKNMGRRLLAGSMIMLSLSLSACSGGVPLPSSTDERETPYWASINRARAIMRRGPSSDMRAMWEYRRMGLPVRILAVREDWRQVEDSEGVIGWMHKRLLTGARGALVTEDAPMYRQPDNSSAISYRAERGVVGKLGECREGYCELDVAGKSGWINAEAIWGDGPPSDRSRADGSQPG